MVSKKNLPYIIVALIAFAAWAPALGGGFVFDDRSLVVENAALRDVRRWPSLLTADAHRFSPAGVSGYHRPLQTVTYAVDSAVWGKRPSGYHLTNVLIHAAAAAAAMKLLVSVGFSPAAAFWAAALFAAHPIHASSVAYVAGRADALAGLFLFLACAYAPSKRAYGFFALALLSRENAFLGPLLVFAAVWARTLEKGKAFKTAAGFAAIAALYAAVRAAGAPQSLELPWTAGHPALPNVLAALLEYARLAVFPWPLYPMHSIPWTDGLTTGTVSLLASLAAAGALVTFADARARSRAGRFALAWAAIGFLPLFALIGAFPRLGACAAENWFYVPGVGIFALAGWAIASSRPARLLAPLLVAAFAALSWIASAPWRDEPSLYRHTLAHAPANENARVNLAAALYERGDLDGAEAALAGLGERLPRLWDALVVKGNVLLGRGRTDDAERAYRDALALHPKAARAWTNLGWTLHKKGDEEASIAAFQKSAQLDPLVWQNHRAIADARLRAGRAAEAVEGYALAVSLGASDAVTYAHWGAALGLAGRHGEAVRALERAVEIREDSETLKNLGSAYANSGREDEARRAWARAERLEKLTRA